MLRVILPALRDSFWRAFWRRHLKYLPPAAHISIDGLYAHVDKDSKVPAIDIRVGRVWA